MSVSGVVADAQSVAGYLCCAEHPSQSGGYGQVLGYRAGGKMGQSMITVTDSWALR